MNVNVAIDLLLSLVLQASRVSAMITAAKARGEDSLSVEDLAILRAENDKARADLVAAIAAAK